jgi:hypothetical protein
MGNFQFYYDFLDYTVTADSENAFYPVVNLEDYDHTRRHYRAENATPGIWVKFNLGSLKTIKGIFINDCNFPSSTVQVCTTDAWGSPDRFNSTLTVSQDIRVGRYKMLCNPALSETAQYVRILMLGSNIDLSVYRAGSIIIAGSLIEFTDNPIYPYSFKADENIVTVDMESGAFEDVNVGPRIWEGTFGFESLRENESQIWTLNSAIPKATNCIFHENCGDTSKAYLCRRRTPIQVTWNNPAMSSFESMTFREVY